MSTAELKTDLYQLIEGINDTTVLKAIHTILKKSIDKDIAGYTSGRKPITKKAFIKRIEKAESEIKRGHYLAIEALKKESESW
ncbi:MAG: hypothetical protein ACLQQ4_19550 [Bacteroidia bacterium]